MTFNKSFRSSRGFSLFEILLVVTIVGFLVVIIGNIPAIYKRVNQSNYQSIAKSIISQKIEDLRSVSFDSLSNGVFNIIDDRLASLPSGAGTYTIIDCPTTICKNQETLKEVDLVISWNEKDQITSAKVVTFISDKSL